MFDLEKAVLDWRHELSRHEAIGIELLDELESHLLEEIDGLRAGGCNDEEAFRRAVRTLGPGAAVHDEVAKIDRKSTL